MTKRFRQFSLWIYDESNDKYMNMKSVVDLLNELSDENSILNKNEDDLKECTIENSKLKEENERLKNKLNVTALELVDEAISMGKAVEISEMSYREFIDYRAEKGKPMELQL